MIGELNMYRESGIKPDFSDIARRYGRDRHTVASYWNAAVIDRVAHHGRLIEFGTPATGSRSRSCSASQEARGVPAPETEKLAC